MEQKWKAGNLRTMWSSEENRVRKGKSYGRGNRWKEISSSTDKDQSVGHGHFQGNRNLRNLKLAFIATEKFCICAILEKSDNRTEICLVIDKLEYWWYSVSKFGQCSEICGRILTEWFFLWCVYVNEVIGI